MTELGCSVGLCTYCVGPTEGCSLPNLNNGHSAGSEVEVSEVACRHVVCGPL